MLPLAKLAAPALSWPGNCAQGSSGDYKLIRQRVCQHMLANRANFEPFVEDDEKFDDYMRVRSAACAWSQAPIKKRKLTHVCMAGNGNGWRLGRPGRTLIGSHEFRSIALQT